MASFVTAYMIVWSFVALYVLRLRGEHQHLTRRIQALENQTGERTEANGHSRAA